MVFSNACIQWIPNHPKLLREMMQLLRPGGILAVQIPINQKEPIHQIIQALAAGEKWKAHFPSPRIFYQLTVSEYYDLLGRSRTALNWGNGLYARYAIPRCHYGVVSWHGTAAVSGGADPGTAAGIRKGCAGRREAGVSGTERRQRDLSVSTAVLFGSGESGRMCVCLRG
ncbi:MAG: methyltransferase domain-containing protein [Ruminococcus sp.]